RDRARLVPVGDDRAADRAAGRCAAGADPPRALRRPRRSQGRGCLPGFAGLRLRDGSDARRRRRPDGLVAASGVDGGPASRSCDPAQGRDLVASSTVTTSSPLEEQFSTLEFDRPADGVLRITLHTPGRLNAVGAGMHSELSAVWPAIGREREVRAVVVRGADGAFSAGGDLELVEEMARDYETRRRVFHEARDLVYNVLNCPTPIV